MLTRRQARALLRMFTALSAAAALIFAVGSAGAADATGNFVQNPSLEAASGSTPTCWLLGGYGGNTYSWTRTTDAHTGTYAEKLDLSSRVSGDRKLLTAFSNGCSPAVTPGHSYNVSVWYKSSAQPSIFAFTRGSSTNFQWWAQSPRLPASSTWQQASWTTPVVPSGVTALSVGLGLQMNGSVTMDDFSLVDTTAAVTGTDTTPPTASISCNSTTCASAYYNQSVNVALAGTDNAGGSGVQSIRYTTDGTTPTLTNGYTYGAPFVIGAPMTIAYRAYDNAGNAGTVGSQTLRFDTAPPSVSMTAPSAGATLSGTNTLTASASDNIGVDHVDFLVDGTKVGSASTAPYALAWLSTAIADGSHTVSARAVDIAGNSSSSAPVTFTVSNVVASPPPPPPPPSSTRQYFGTEPPGTSGLPRSDSYCADHILLSSWEPNHGNLSYNVPKSSDPSPYDTWWNSYPAWLALRSQADGNFVNSDGSVPTDTEVFSFAACKWGIDENLLRAVSVQETDWSERFWGDRCNLSDPSQGIGSYGIMQVKNRNCSNQGDWGGYPRTYDSTTYNVDFYGAAFRACLDRDLWYSYGSTTDVSTLVRGCVGAWFSGSFDPSSAYTNSVYQHLANKDWLTY
jgi:hypothetical protein